MSQSLNLEIKQLTEKAVKDFRTKMPANNKVKGNGTFEVVATTDSLDRDGEVLSIDGWDFKNYLNNPAVVWGHDWYSKPIGAVTDITIEDGKIIMKGVFADTPAGQEVRSLYDSGILRTVSVGYFPMEKKGNVVTRKEMVELSFVTIPANPDATNTREIKAMKKVEKMLSDEESTEEEGETKVESEVPEKPEVQHVEVVLPKADDIAVPEAKGLEGKVGRVLSAKNITTIQSAITAMGNLKNQFDTTVKLLQDVVDSANPEKGNQDDDNQKAFSDEMTKSLQMIVKTTSELLRKRKNK
jgi:HK97 family phage prohead protease